MELATKGGLVVLGLASVITPLTAVAIANKSKPGKHYYNPKTLSNYRETTYQGKYAYYFGKHFVDASISNKEWWDKSYARLLSDKNSSLNTISDKFKNVNSAFGEDKDKSLNKLCESYHSHTFSEFNTGSNQNEINTVVKNFWKFCTTVEAELEMASSSNSDSSKIRGKHKNILIDAESGKNSKFWDVQEEIFFDNAGTEVKDKTNSMFYHLHNTARETGSRKNLREVCLESYDKDFNQEDESITVLFCTISGQKTTN